MGEAVQIAQILLPERLVRELSIHAAIVFPPDSPADKPYVLVVLTTGFLSQAEADQAIAGISRIVWEQHDYRGTTPVIAPPGPRDG